MLHTDHHDNSTQTVDWAKRSKQHTVIMKFPVVDGVITYLHAPAKKWEYNKRNQILIRSISQNKSIWHGFLLNDSVYLLYRRNRQNATICVHLPAYYIYMHIVCWKETMQKDKVVYDLPIWYNNRKGGHVRCAGHYEHGCSPPGRQPQTCAVIKAIIICYT